MSEFSVNTSAIKDSVGKLDTIEKEMREFEIRLSAVKDNNHNKHDDANKSVNDEQAYKKSMMDAYGFSDEEAELLMDAYNKFIESEEAKGMSNKEKINAFYSNLVSLYSGYSSDSKLFGAMGDNPSQAEAIKFFNDLGGDGESLKEIFTQKVWV